jgi:xylulokinase
LTGRHGPAHLTRSILEGVAFGLKDIFCLMKDAGLASVEQIRLSGGGAKSSLWRQILADVFAAELVTVNTTEGAAFGAALLAGVGAGVWSNVDEACAQTVFVSESIVPNTSAVETYRAMYEHYQSLYPALKQTFHEL